jgi:hypothetical protein
MSEPPVPSEAPLRVRGQDMSLCDVLTWRTEGPTGQELVVRLVAYRTAGAMCSAWVARIDAKPLGRFASRAEAALAIEDELTRVESEIRAAREGVK